jgi:AhpD family alkylhydroperoxidase
MAVFFNQRNKEANMTREQIYDEIKEMLGIVPTFLKSVPDNTLELEWRLFQQTQFSEGPIPNKYRELIGLGIAAVSKCRYCALFHTEAAKLNGATQAEIEDAVHFAKSSAGWSAYINGMQIDYDQFKKEVQQITNYIRTKETSKEREVVRSNR